MPTPPLILLVDDEPEVVELYGKKLKMAGFQVITAVNGKEALAIAREKHPDLILLDFKMPEMNGIEVLIKLKESPETRDLKVVFLTAFSDPAVPEVDIQAAKNIGAVDYIKKGLELDKLIEKIRTYL